MNWLKLPISQFCKTGSGGTPSRAKLERFYGGDIPWVKSGELKDAILTETSEHITEFAIVESSAKLVESGAVLVAMYGATVGRTALLGIDATTNQAVCHILPNEKIASNKFVWYALREKLSELLFRRVGGAQPNINQQIIKETVLSIPPLKEQRRIVKILDQADELRRKRTEADQKAERILPAMFIKMFGDPATNPKDLKITTLGKVSKEFRYGTSVRCETNGHGFPVLRIPNVLKGEIDLTDLKYAELNQNETNTLKLMYGDIIFVRTNGNPDYVGRCSVFDKEQTILFASYLIRARIKRDLVNPWFVTSYLQTFNGRQAMAPFIRTTAGQSNINIDGLKQIPIPLPKVEVQEQFINYFFQLRKIKNDSQKSEILISNIFKNLLQRAFSGELTAKWRESHLKELLEEMEIQRRELDIKDSKAAMLF